MAKHNEIGKLGEDLAAKWLRNIDFAILERNYLKKYGEIDIVARETEIIHFIEVKTVSYETKRILEDSVSRGTWRPEENVHFEKQKRLARTIEAWIHENEYYGDWQIDVLTVRVVPREKFASFMMIENVIFE
ncbi:MAG: YraN family protein [Candidatus Pacebacteria bacterium]|nr:YraN family protein [Candidatus Paceibacterota bacterium]MCF7857356.1 YraN family protein [Candidatus Paceibacterota bacterium]